MNQKQAAANTTKIYSLEILITSNMASEVCKSEKAHDNMLSEVDDGGEKAFPSI